MIALGSVACSRRLGSGIALQRCAEEQSAGCGCAYAGAVLREVAQLVRAEPLAPLAVTAASRKACLHCGRMFGPTGGRWREWLGRACCSTRCTMERRGHVFAVRPVAGPCSVCGVRCQSRSGLCRLHGQVARATQRIARGA